MPGNLDRDSERVFNPLAQTTRPTQQQIEEKTVDAASLAAIAAHDISNVLSSAVVNINLLRDLLKNLNIDHFDRAVQKLNSRLLNQKEVEAQDRLLLEYFQSFSYYLKEFLNSSKKEVAHLERYTAYIKCLLNAQQEPQDEILEEVDVNSLIEEAVHLSHFRSDEGRQNFQNCVIEKHYADLPLIKILKVHRYKLIQTLINLLINARNAVREANATGRKIKITSSFEENEFIVITVEDSGIGIESQYLEKIFERGFTTRHTGRGLGLFSAAACVRELGGALTVESAGLNQGAIFRLSLPI